jgi:hypothetical protein
MKTRARSIAVLFLWLLPLVLWFGLFSAVYGGQTLACLLPASGRAPFSLGFGIAAVLTLAGVGAVAHLWRTRAGTFYRNGVHDIALLAAIGVGLVAVAALVIPLC